MRRLIILLALSILSFQLIQAGGVGISPVYYKEFFEPNLEKEYIFHAFNTNPEKGINLYVKGDLAEYVNLSKTYLLGGGDFVVTIKLPSYIEKPGTHRISIGAIESSGEFDKANLGGIAAIQGRIDIFVPYPGKYSESTFQVSNINQGEKAPYEMEVNNLGTDSLQVKPTIEIFKPNTTEVLVTERLSETLLQSKETFRVTGTLDTRDLPPGDYDVVATIDWEEKQTILNQTLRVGEFLVEIIDYDYEFEQGKINPFRIEVQNKWNAKIDEVFASVSITDNGVVVGDFKTVTIDTSSWEIKNITGYFDTSTLETKRYTSRIDLFYDGESSSKLVAIYIKAPPKKTYIAYIIVITIVIILIIIAFTYLILKLRKLEQSKNEKKK